jgi:molybdenum-dependent DNA-binding transcriptional regulator ModE
MARWAKTHNIPLRPRGGGIHNQVRATLGQATTAPHVLRPALTGHGAWGRLRRFAAAAEHPTIGTAATALGLNPPTLVTQINRLERDLGGQLLTRAERGQPMVLTPLGRKVIAAIRRHCSESSQHQRAWRAAVPPCRTATPPLPRPHLASPFGDPYNR